ncbi:MAG TPA: peptidoglycan-binding domain-containing protein [Bryobacteraceae bacterium]|nr:peptidoglycan-binding domain-containing protein [Bryobacteraceae bacterium]
MSRILRYGSTGIEVRNLQAALNFQMCPRFAPLATNGDFGTRTLVRLQEFQRGSNLTPDGIVGPATWRALLPAYRIASRILVLPNVVAPRLPVPTVLSGRVPAFEIRTPGDVPPRPNPGETDDDQSLQLPRFSEPLRLRYGNVQFQSGRQFTARPWIGPYAPSLGFASLVVAVQFNYIQRVFGRNLQGRRLELAWGGQIAANEATSDNRYTVTAYTQATVADLLRTDWIHWASLFLQAGLNVNIDAPGATLVAVAGHSLNIDIVDGVLSLFIQNALALSLDLATGLGTIGYQVMGGLIVEWDRKDRTPGPGQQ